MNEPWDKPVRGDQYSIVTKRRLLGRFEEDPTQESLKRFTRSLWAYDTWESVDFPVQERFLGKGHTPEEFRDFLRGVKAGERSRREPDTPDIGVWVISEILEAMDPETYATLNAESSAGMEALGYSVPDIPLEDQGGYWEFVESVEGAVERYSLRKRVVASGLEELPDEVPAVDVAQVAFQMHADDEFDFDLGAVSESARED